MISTLWTKDASMFRTRGGTTSCMTLLSMTSSECSYSVIIVSTLIDQ